MHLSHTLPTTSVLPPDSLLWCHTSVQLSLDSARTYQEMQSLSESPFFMFFEVRSLEWSRLVWNLDMSCCQFSEYWDYRHVPPYIAGEKALRLEWKLSATVLFRSQRVIVISSQGPQSGQGMHTWSLTEGWGAGWLKHWETALSAVCPFKEHSAADIRKCHESHTYVFYAAILELSHCGRSLQPPCYQPLTRT